ncbi:winged helix-turn-helix domain-containing protein [Mangrovibacter sp. SLW1]
MDEFDWYIDSWKLDFSGESLIHHDTGEIRKLGEYPFRLLTELAGNAGKVLLKEELLAVVWPGRIVGINSLPAAVHSVRKAVDDDGRKQKIIHPVPGQATACLKRTCDRSPENTPGRQNQTRHLFYFRAVAAIQRVRVLL